VHEKGWSAKKAAEHFKVPLGDRLSGRFEVTLGDRLSGRFEVGVSRGCPPHIPLGDQRWPQGHM